MFETRRKLQRYQAACYHYEDQLMKKTALIHETEGMLQQAASIQKVLEECNDALAKENKRLGDNRDLDADLMEEIFAEYKDMLGKYRRVEELEDENYRLWVENALLRGALARLAPRQAAEIARCAR